ncbi:hypothetical protein CYLTODRAFT_430790 [Cylindrobasidium torrendii FP15055 ss-10]|uniref:Extracellular metalloproteinase n=1 Tax=Cylindrobasidium torrendii FP15055 ss-10 TaxID=1314674 RepID=A0A0D7BF38_9AGAR|nr:hypothetical protein CYLTODRAFT_430790 [Cylindrobasidium torrendii FP15055 ss-10]
MLSFTKLLSFVLLAVSAGATPLAPNAKHATHRKRVIGRGLEVETYHPSVSYQDGIDFVNAVANVAFKDNKVVALGSSLVDASNIADSTPSIAVEDVIADVEEKLDGKFNGYKSVSYLARDDGSIALTHAIQIQNEDVNSWYEAFVDAHTGELINVIDFVNDLSYRVLPIWKQQPSEGIELLVNPEITAASPNGWVTSNTTAGNNVVAYKSSQSAVTTGFDYTYSTSAAPSTTNNLNAARVNSFYIINAYHDILYLYGFTEAAYNFQTNNFGKGGAANDRVLMSVQDSSGTNNANFATPPDGQSGTCRMYIWTYTSPNRDGDLENDIPVHEVTHGLTNRVTGGGTGRCLQTTEAGGMGEGWSDALAFWTEQTTGTVKDFTMGSWVVNDAAGIRSYPYSTSASTNPLRYSTIASLNEVHAIGEVWANLLINVYAALIAEHGFSTTARTNASGSEGNVVWLRLLVDALALQPCNPTLPTARDAWIQADQNRYAGANKCLLWKAFASRGLGVGAANHVDSTAVPSGC